MLFGLCDLWSVWIKEEVEESRVELIRNESYQFEDYSIFIYYLGCYESGNQSFSLSLKNWG